MGSENGLSLPVYDFPQPRSNSISSAPRPYTSYDPAMGDVSPQAADFVRSMSDHGRGRERASTGPSTIPPRAQTGSHMAWNSDQSSLLGPPPSLESLPETPSFLLSRSANDRIGGAPFSNMYQPVVNDRQSFPPFYPESSATNSYTISSQIGRPLSPRTAAPGGSPFYFNAPNSHEPGQQPGPTAFASSLGNEQYYNPLFGARRPSEPNIYQSRQSDLAQPVPMYAPQTQRHTFRMEQEAETASGGQQQHVPIWLQQQQYSVDRE